MEDQKIRDIQRQLAKLSGTIAHMAGDRPVLLFADYAMGYMEAKISKPSLRASTKTSFKNQVIKHLVPAFGRLPLDKVTNAEWLRWVSSVVGVTRFFNARKTMIEILSAAREEGHLERIPKLDNPDEPRSTGRTLFDPEVYALLRKTRRPFRFIFYTFWKMGCRPREILRWEWSMIKWGEPGKTWIEIPARISKTGRARSIPINPTVSRILKIRHARGNNSPFVFPAQGFLTRPQLSYHGAWATACRRAKVKAAVVYDFRRTFITRAAASGKPLIYVAKFLDTSAQMIERVYAKAQADVLESIANW